MPTRVVAWYDRPVHAASPIRCSLKVRDRVEHTVPALEGDRQPRIDAIDDGKPRFELALGWLLDGIERGVPDNSTDG
jgi:hypothetical protein